MMEETRYDALIEAKVSEEKARAAAKAVSNYNERMYKIEADLGLLKRMVGTNVVLSIGILIRLLTV